MDGTYSTKSARRAKRLRRYERTESENLLGVLLEDEDLLLKVLFYVMDEGLHECRLVCRQWREACGKLPLKLDRVHLNDLHKVPRAFPKTTALVLNHTPDTMYTVERAVIRHLVKLTNLSHLHFYLVYNQLDCNTAKTWFSVMDRLKTLGLWIDDNNTLLDVFCLLRRLTNLLSLKLVVVCEVLKELDPVTELRGLTELAVDIQVFANKRTELLFPSLTELRCLNVVLNCPVIHPQYDGVDLQVRHSLTTRIGCTFACLML